MRYVLAAMLLTGCTTNYYLTLEAECDSDGGVHVSDGLKGSEPSDGGSTKSSDMLSEDGPSKFTVCGNQPICTACYQDCCVNGVARFDGQCVGCLTYTQSCKY
jgi:hypothetical protein